MKKVISIVIALILVFSLAACGNSAAKDAAGTYPGDYGKFVGDPDSAATKSEGVEEFSLELDAKGNGVFKRDDSEFKCTWKLDGENFTMTETFLGAKNEYTGTLKDGILTIYNGDPSNDFTYQYVFQAKE